jgi:iron(III) transport system substrate-binding protein
MMIKLALAGAIACLLWAADARAQTLVIDGEEIADAKLFADAKKEGRVDVYGTYPSENLSPVLDAFRKETGLTMEYVRLPTSRLYDRVLAEFQGGKLDVDYADLTDLTLIKDWVSKGILAKHKVPWFDKIPAELRDKDGSWIYIVRPIQTIAVNTELVEPKDYPKSWKDTFDPKWKGKMGSADIDAGGSALTLFAFLRLKVDEKSWEKIAAQEPRLYASVAPVVNDLVRGRIALAYGGASSFTQAIKEKAPLKVLFPSEGEAAFGAMGNVTTTAKHPNAAKVWVNWVTSKHGSGLVAKTGSYGTYPGAPAPTDGEYQFPPDSQVWNISSDMWDRIHESWPDEWKKIFKRQ